MEHMLFSAIRSSIEIVDNVLKIKPCMSSVDVYADRITKSRL